MPNFKINTKELILKQNSRTSGIETFVYEPSTIDEECLGNLYIIGWLTNSRQDLSFIANVIASVIKREFYKRSSSQDPYIHFESAIQKANDTFRDVAKTNKNILEDIGICAVNIADNKIRFSFIGKCSLLLFRNNELIRINESLMGSHDSPNESSGGFINIVNGDIEENDKLIVSTFMIMDLFSDTGIIKLFQLPQDEQAEIITKIFQKNSKDSVFPDQAVILLDVQSPKTQGVLSFTKTLRTKANIISEAPSSIISKSNLILNLRKSNPKKAFVNISTIRLHKNSFIISLVLIIVIITSFISIAVFAKYAIITEAYSNVTKAESLFVSSPDEASALLIESQNMVYPLLSVWYLHNKASEIFSIINKDINRIHNIYIDPPLIIGSFPAESVLLQPQFIADDENTIYVFGNDSLFFYKIDKKSFYGSFTSTTSPLDEYVKNVKKQHKQRDMSDALYTLHNNGNKIIKHSKLSTISETFLLGDISHIIDFTVSYDNKYIYILTGNQILFIENSN